MRRRRRKRWRISWAAVFIIVLPIYGRTDTPSYRVNSSGLKLSSCTGSGKNQYTHVRVYADVHPRARRHVRAHPLARRHAPTPTCTPAHTRTTSRAHILERTPINTHAHPLARTHAHTRACAHPLICHIPHPVFGHS